MDVFLFGNRSLCLRWCFVVCITPYPFKFDTISRLQVADVMFSFYVPTIFAIVFSLSAPFMFIVVLFFLCGHHICCGAFLLCAQHICWNFSTRFQCTCGFTYWTLHMNKYQDMQKLKHISNFSFQLFIGHP